MRRVYFLFCVLIIICPAIFAGPFGLSCGMTYQEVTEACGGVEPNRISNDDRYYIKPVKSHSRFKTYIGWINDEYGLYAVRGISGDISMDKYGHALQNAFYDFKNRISDIYGKGEVVDKIINNDIFDFKKKNDYWSETLKEGDRKLYAEWTIGKKGFKEKDEVIYIQLWTIAEGYSNFRGTLLIDYYFTNSVLVEMEEDEVL